MEIQVHHNRRMLRRHQPNATIGDDGTWEGKRSGKWEKGNKKRKNGKVSTYMDSM